jgi:NADH-quinone oxidoreductase subunit N
MTWNDTLILMPELILAIGGALLLIAPVIGGRNNARSAQVATSILLVIAMGSVIFTSASAGTPSPEFAGMFVADGFALFFKLLLTIAVLLVGVMAERYLSEASYSAWEFYSLMVFALCGMYFMASGSNLVTIYVGLELMSLSSYILAGYYKNEHRSTEAAMKYLILGAASSGILLYGISLIFGVTGSLSLSVLTSSASLLASNQTLMFGIMLLGAGLCFKIAAAPFHVWTPDVYQGAPTPITAFLATASKTAAIAIFARIFIGSLAAMQPGWSTVIAAVAALSMVLGNVAAVTQDNVKRMLAYSSIGHAGYLLLGILAANQSGARGVLVYAAVYLFATIGIWTTVLVMRRHTYAGERIDDFEGLSRRAPFWAFAMVVFLLSLGGIPPTAGFIGKYFLFAAAVQAGFGWLAVIAVLMSAVSMAYYLRIVVAMYLKDGSEGALEEVGGMRLVAGLCLAVTLILGMMPSPLIERVDRSIRPLFAGAAALHARR